MPRRKFIVEVPCTTVDRYEIFADSEAEVRERFAAGDIGVEQFQDKPGDYRFIGGADEHEPVTHWDKAEIITEESI